MSAFLCANFKPILTFGLCYSFLGVSEQAHNLSTFFRSLFLSRIAVNDLPTQLSILQRYCNRVQKNNAHVLKILVKSCEEKITLNVPQFYTPGSEDEATIFVCVLNLIASTTGAGQLVKKIFPNLSTRARGGNKSSAGVVKVGGNLYGTTICHSPLTTEPMGKTLGMIKSLGRQFAAKRGMFMFNTSRYEMEKSRNL